MDLVWILSLSIGLGLLIHVDTSATCVEKFLDGQTAETKHVVTEGERVTLRCDVSARDQAKDTLYWKFGDRVMSQDDKVIPKYQSKFSVTLENDVYTISWRAELDDTGNYTCQCAFGGIEYQVRIKRQGGSSSTCVEKFLDGQTAATKHEVIEGERVTLRCDVSNRDPAKDMVYWKFDDDVLAQDDIVIPKYQSKFNVTLEKDIYTISWIAELDDAGKYNCTCTTGGIQYPVWIKRPCNERKHVINTTDPSTESNCTTSPEVLDFLLTNYCHELEVGESLNVSIALDCNCTWPEVNRTFIGVWYTEVSDTSVRCHECDKVEDVLINAIGKEDTSITPIGCYTGKGSVTYRYRNVFGRLNSVFTCTMAMLGKEYSLYIDEGQSTRPPPLIKICCDDWHHDPW